MEQKRKENQLAVNAAEKIEGEVYMKINVCSTKSVLGYRTPCSLAVIQAAKKHEKYQRVFILQTGRDIPGQFLEAYLRKEFSLTDKISVIADFCWWNGSYHGPYYEGLDKGQAVVFVRGRKIKNIFSRIKKAAARAIEDWQAIEYEALNARLVERGVWRAVGD